MKDFRGCGQTQPSHVCDPSHLLSTAGAQAVDAILKQIEDNFKATCGKNYQVALAVVDKNEVWFPTTDLIQKSKSI